MSSFKAILCEQCSKHLLYADIVEGRIARDCPRCGHRNIITIRNSLEIKRKYEFSNKRYLKQM